MQEVELNCYIAIHFSGIVMCLVEKPTFLTDSLNSMALFLASCVGNAAVCLLAVQAVHMTSPVLICIAFSMQVGLSLLFELCF